MVLQLAALDPSANIAYLARPCQYVLKEAHDRNCESRYWSKERFGQVVVSALDEAVTYLKNKAGASRVNLIGYSGGGGLAVLVAAGRDDIASLRTIGGNLDHREFTRHNKVTPLIGSLNPVDVAAGVGMIPQIHFSGNRDRTVPKSVAEKFMARLPDKHCAVLVPVRGASHNKGWQKVWPDLLDMALPCMN
jgi:dienelactone hydrolase